MSKTTKIDSLAAEVVKILEEYAGGCAEDVKAAVDTVSRETVAELQRTSPRAEKHRNKDIYAEGWSSDVKKNKKSAKTRVIHNATSYRRTALLEHGHAVVDRNLRKHGKTRGLEHIAPAEARAVARLDEMIRKAAKQ